MSSELPAEIQKQIDRGIARLLQGGVIAYPTDTVYGLGGGAYISSAVERVFQIKKRPLHMAVPLLLADISQIEEVARDVPPLAWRLAHKFLPGGLTIILFRSKLVPDIVTAGGDTVGVRIPAHPIPLALIKGAGMPLVGTSANRSGQPSPLTADDVRDQIGGTVDLIIDGGRSPGGKESTVVDLTGEKLRIVREGVIPGDKIKETCGIS